MREKINRLARGIPEEELPVLVVSPEFGIDLPLRQGEVLRTAVQVGSANSVPLKGLAYSDAVRVRVLRPSFGGRRNQVVLEADGRNLSAGDVIEGQLSLVTNGGERSLPFRFAVTDGAAALTLSRLKTLRDFAMVAGADPDTALRIFEYREFASAPFMKDLRLQALRSAFGSGPDREAALEEFLVSAGAKKPALVRPETDRIELHAAEQAGTEALEAQVTLVRVRDGYFALSVRAEGQFFSLKKRSVTSRDFRGSACTYDFRIDRKRLHEGRNEGRLLFRSARFSFSVPVTVWREASEEEADSREQRLLRRQRLAEYTAMRLKYETVPEKDPSQGLLMAELLEEAGAKEEGAFRLRLLKAEALLLSGDTKQSRALLEGVADAVRAARMEDMETYLLMEAVRARLPEGAERKESSVLLLRKYLEEEHMHRLLPFYLTLKPELYDRDPASLKEFLEELRGAGCRSPFLYAAFAKLYERYPGMLREFRKTEADVLRFSLTAGLPGEEAAAAYTAAAGTLKSFSESVFRSLAGLYEVHPSKELLTTVCTALIRMDCRTEEAHGWYLKGVEENIRLTGLCEYAVFSMPKEQRNRLPREVFLYFSYDNRLDDRSRAMLYENLCRFRKKETALWEEYAGQISDFTMEQLRKKNVNRHLAVLYRELLTPELLDRRLAGVLPEILDTERISCSSEYMRAALLVCPELKAIQKRRLENGTAYMIPKTEADVLLFEDEYGNRFCPQSLAAQTHVRAERVCDMPEVRRRCQELFAGEDEGEGAVLKRLAALPSDRPLSEKESALVRAAIAGGTLSEGFSGKLLGILLSHPEGSLDFLSSLPAGRLDRTERRRLLEILGGAGQTAKAWALMKEYLIEDLEPETLKELCSRVILEQLFPEDGLLLSLSAKVFRSGAADAVIRDYLSGRWNSSTEEMYRLWKESEGEPGRSSDLPERLLAQMLFTGRTEHLEEVFSSSLRDGRCAEAILRACVTERCAAYFLEDRELNQDMAAWLEATERRTEDKRRLPLIYRLALTKRWANRPVLTEAQKGAAEQILPGLLDEGLFFPYYKNLARFIPVPEEVLDRECVAFRGERGASYGICMRILPGEQEFRTEPLRRMYLDIFVRQEILFAGETWEFSIRKQGQEQELFRGEVRRQEETDFVSGQEAFPEPRSRYGSLNQLTALLEKKDEKLLQQEMERFAVQEDLVAGLFGLLEKGS